jgi:hypothetical protein
VDPPVVETYRDVCPLCLGEFIIHEEQGVPPSKVTVINTRIDPQVLTKEQLIEFQRQLKAEGIIISQKK